MSRPAAAPGESSSVAGSSFPSCQSPHQPCHHQHCSNTDRGATQEPPRTHPTPSPIPSPLWRAAHHGQDRTGWQGTGCGQVIQAVKLIERGAKGFENLKPIPSPNEAKPQTFISAPGSRWLLPARHERAAETWELARRKALARRVSLFFQQKNIDFVLIGASADIQELGEELPGTGPALPQAVAPHPCPTAGQGAPHSHPRAPAGASVRPGASAGIPASCPSSPAGAVSAPPGPAVVSRCWEGA